MSAYKTEQEHMRFFFNCLADSDSESEESEEEESLSLSLLLDDVDDSLLGRGTWTASSTYSASESDSEDESSSEDDSSLDDDFGIWLLVLGTGLRARLRRVGLG